MTTKTQEVNAKGAQTTALKTLTPIAREINVRMDKASKLDNDAFDHRLAASLHIANAKTICEKAKLKFEDWCKENISLAYETARKLAVVGASGDETKARLALEDLRAAGAKRQAKHRQTAKGTGNRSTPTPAPTAPNKSVAAPSPIIQAMETIKAAPQNVRENMAREISASAGLIAAPKDRLKADGNDYTVASEAFDAMTSGPRLMFLLDKAKAMGLEIPASWTAKPKESQEDPLGVPSFLKGEDAKPVRKRRPKAS